MKKLAIVSSFDESCGIAVLAKIVQDTVIQYTGHQVEVLRLDLILLQSVASTQRKLADEHIQDICTKIKDFDAVNIQLEIGLFGILPKDITKRVIKVAKAHPKTSVTFHTLYLLSPESSREFKSGLKCLFKLQFVEGISMICRSLVPAAYVKIYQTIMKNLVQAGCRIIVHTQRAKKQIQRMYHYDHIQVHPLKIVTFNEPINQTLFEEFCDAFHIDGDDKVISMFGYLGKYKGHLDGVDAMKYLPENYKLVIFGRQHPQSIRHSRMDEYIMTLMDKVRVSKSLRKRVFFMGELNDAEFINMAASVDMVWLPYYETGQEGSGIASICFDVAKRVICSNALLFDELLKLIPDEHIMRFDIGNFLELANKTIILMKKNLSSHHARYTQDAYTIKTQALLYAQDLMKCAEFPA